MSYSCVGTPVCSNTSSLYLVDKCRRVLVHNSSFTSVERRLVNIGREWTRCCPIPLWMSNPCLYFLLSVTSVRSVPVFNCTWRWVLPPHPLVVCVVTSMTLDMSAACCCCNVTSFSLSSSDALGGWISHNGFVSAFFRMSCSLIIGTRRAFSSCSSERTSARSLCGGMALIWSRETSLYGVSPQAVLHPPCFSRVL